MSTSGLQLKCVSRIACSAFHHLVMPRRSFPTRLFAFLAKPEWACTCAEINECMMDSWTKVFLTDHPTLEDEECKCKLTLLAGSVAG